MRMAPRLLCDRQHRSFPVLAGRQIPYPTGREAQLASRHAQLPPNTAATEILNVRKENT
jgi:hypothetical protein